MRLSEWGQVASRYWKRIPAHVAHVELDEWVVMPNHIHGIVVITGRGQASPGSASSTGNLTTGGTRLPGQGSARDAWPLLQPVLQPGSLGAIVGNYKSVTTGRVNRLRGMPGTPFWQRYYWTEVSRQSSVVRSQFSQMRGGGLNVDSRFRGNDKGRRGHDGHHPPR